MRGQQEAILKTTGPCIILAGAGTGKTFTIVEKIKYLITNKIYEPQKIVCVTFSNEAVNSIRTRLLNVLNEGVEPVVKTFHALCAHLLRIHGDKINLPTNYSILLPDNAKVLLHTNFKVGVKESHEYINTIGIAKDQGISYKDYETWVNKKYKDIENVKLELQNTIFELQVLHNNDKNNDKKEFLEEKISYLSNLLKVNSFLRVWCAYEKIKTLKGYLDYADLNIKALELLDNFPSIAEDYSYIVVDEFQDTNKVQCDLLKLLTPHHNITLVGDVNQSIYRFRGAYKDNLQYISNYFEVLPNDIFALNVSFRSTNRILKIAHQLIINNYQNVNECFKLNSASGEEGEKLGVFELRNSNEEVRKILEIIKSQMSKGIPPEEICVLFRTHQQARVCKKGLEHENIPFTSVSKQSLLKMSPIKIVCDYLRIVYLLKNNLKGGEHSWWSVVYESNFSKPDCIIIGKFIRDLQDNNCLSLMLFSSNSIPNLSSNGLIKWHYIQKNIKELLKDCNIPVPDFVLRVYSQLGLQGIPLSSMNAEQVLILQKFHEISVDYSQRDGPNISGFIDYLDVLQRLGIEIESPQIRQAGVRILTHHATKGLEYHTVIVAGMSQKRFPNLRISDSLIPTELSPEFSQVIKGISDNDKNKVLYDLELKNKLFEERRLCYVAFTRAKKELYITYALKYSGQKSFPSQFLQEINFKENPDINFINDDNVSYNIPPSRIIQPSLISIVRADNPLLLLPESANKFPEKIVFSPSSLQLYDECEKKYEYRYVFHMPQPMTVSFDALKLGSFVHLVLQQGVKNCLNSEKEFFDCARNLQMEDKWNFINLENVFPLIRSFFLRHYKRFSHLSLTEQPLNLILGSVQFNGIADRIDILNDGFIDIIDYKTGIGKVLPRYRNWQLGLYALAANKIGKPRQLILDVLRADKPIIFELDSRGIAKELHSKKTSFSLDVIRKELLETSQKIINSYKTSFKSCPIEKNCNFCQEFV